MTQNYNNYYKKYYQEHKMELKVRRQERRAKARLKGDMTNYNLKKYYKDFKTLPAKSYTYEWRMWYQASKRAAERGLPFTIQLEDIKIPDICPLLGIKLVRDFSDRSSAPSLDRVIPELGYTKENIRVISMKANTMKRDLSIEFIEKLLVYMKGG